MKRLSALIILCAGGCGSSGVDIGDVPPISIGGGGAALMQDARTPREAYDLAHARLHNYHQKLELFLTGRTPNELGAHKTLKQIIESLQTMQAVTVDPWKKNLQPHIEWYTSYLNLPKTGSFIDQAKRRERIFKTEFGPTVVDVLIDWPAGMKPDTKPETGAKVPPVPDETKPKPTDTKPPSSDVPLWMLYGAWKQAHQDLVDAYVKAQDCAKPYKRVREAMAALRGRMSDERAKKLNLCDSIYEQQHDETKGFKSLPEGAKQEDVLRPLEMVAKTMNEYDPDKK